jgi:hypothetical protein
MKKSAIGLAVLLLLSGCRLSRSPEALAPARPAPAPAPTGSLKPAAGARPEAASAPTDSLPPTEAAASPMEIASLPTSPALGGRDYYDALAAFIAQAQAEAGKGTLADLQTPQGALTGANYSLSLLETSLPRVWVLQGLSRARQLLAEQKPAPATELLGQLAHRLQDSRGSLPEAMKNCAGAIIKCRDNIAAGKIAAASGSLAELAKQLSTSTALAQLQEIRANLQEAGRAAERNQPAVVKALLEDTALCLAKLETLLPAPQSREKASQ